ncbi:MAG: hypothetical protein ACD_33C00045G0023 [uncultured bacterium]|nr:MAG: hypothetical protein ACD_33C00045G0023 [uncultured bacterium]
MSEEHDIDKIVDEISDEELLKMTRFCNVFIPVKFNHLDRKPYTDLEPLRSLLKLFLKRNNSISPK